MFLVNDVHSSIRRYRSKFLVKSFTIFLFCMPIVISLQASAAAIFEMRKSFPLEPNEIAYHDYYINAGSEVGLKRGVYVNVTRMMPVTDPAQNRVQGTLGIPVGKVMIIHVEKNLSVGRSAQELADDERPVLEFEGLMIGDQVDIESATVEAPKKRKRPVRDASAYENIKPEVNKAASVERAAEPAKTESAKAEVLQAAPTNATTNDSAAGKETESVTASEPAKVEGAQGINKSFGPGVQTQKSETLKPSPPKQNNSQNEVDSTLDIAAPLDAQKRLPAKLPPRRARAQGFEQTT